MASLPCHRIVAFASEQSFATPLLLAIAPSPSTSLGVVGARWPWMRRKHRMLDSLANCVRERMERAKNGNGHFIRTGGNGICTGTERERLFRYTDRIWELFIDAYCTCMYPASLGYVDVPCLTRVRGCTLGYVDVPASLLVITSPQCCYQ